jgi:diaminopimelate epimerase
MAAFAKKLGLITDTANFLAIDGPHKASIAPDGLISLHMQAVPSMVVRDGHVILNTGSPHFVKWVPDVDLIDVYTEGKAIRNQEEFQPHGINVNFVEIQEGKLRVRTYERGVEGETLSCGTGVTAAAIAATADLEGIFATTIDTPGGQLSVSFTKHNPMSATDVVLTGPAIFVFQGEI